MFFHRIKIFISFSCFLFCLIKRTCLFFGFIFLLNSCVVGFRNSNNHIPEEYTNVYIPAAYDSSTYSGNSGRLSSEVRKALSERSDIQFTSLQNARWALQIKILDRKQAIVSVDSCQNPATPTVGSNAFSCVQIHPELVGGSPTSPTSFNQPSVSPSSESLLLRVEVKAIDLNSGATMLAKVYSSNSATFDEIGDTSDGRTKIYTQWTPDIHILRHNEAVDSAVQTVAKAIAADIKQIVISSMPSRNH